MFGIVAYLGGDIDRNIYYISYVEVHKSYRVLGLCSLLLKHMIEKTMCKKYILFNEGGISACKCYINSFKQYNYVIDNVCSSCNNIDCNVNREMKFI